MRRKIQTDPLPLAERANGSSGTNGHLKKKIPLRLVGNRAGWRIFLGSESKTGFPPDGNDELFASQSSLTECEVPRWSPFASPKTPNDPGSGKR